jgi:hypothetical protein
LDIRHSVFDIQKTGGCPNPVHKSFYVEGLSKLVVYRFEEAADKTAAPVPPEFSDSIATVPAESLFQTMR